MKTAEQAVHDELWKRLSGLVAGNVYESRPMNDVGYPFADFADSDVTFTGTKNGYLSQVATNVNIWDVQEKRQNVSSVCNRLFLYASLLQGAYGYRVALRTGDSSIKIIEDRTVTPSVWRGIVTLVFDIL